MSTYLNTRTGITVEAIQWDGNNMKEVQDFTEGVETVYDSQHYMPGDLLYRQIYFRDPKGDKKRVNVGDYFIKTQDGEISSVSKLKFERLYNLLY